jgi:hypothetical protein
MLDIGRIVSFSAEAVLKRLVATREKVSKGTQSLLLGMVEISVEPKVAIVTHVIAVC